MKAAPTPFGPERAEAIWAQVGPACSFKYTDMTPGEDAYVRQVWDTLPDSSSWMTAFFKIRNGK